MAYCNLDCHRNSQDVNTSYINNNLLDRIKGRTREWVYGHIDCHVPNVIQWQGRTFIWKEPPTHTDRCCWLRLIVGCSWSVLNLTLSRHKKRGGCILSPIWKDKSHNILTLISLASPLPNQYNSTYRLHFHFVEYRLSIHNKNPDHMTTHIRELRMFVHIQKQWKIPWEKLFILWWSS